MVVLNYTLQSLQNEDDFNLKSSVRLGFCLFLLETVDTFTDNNSVGLICRMLEK